MQAVAKGMVQTDERPAIIIFFKDGTGRKVKISSCCQMC
jgi:hypothetical protein